jgi:hypothetical protein
VTLCVYPAVGAVMIMMFSERSIIKKLRHGSEAGHVKLLRVPEERKPVFSSLLVRNCRVWMIVLYIRRGRIMCT